LFVWRAWCLLMMKLDLRGWVWRVLGGEPWCWLVVLAVMLVPPAVALTLAEAVRTPAYNRIRGTAWTRADTFRQMLWQRAASLLPLGLVAAGGLSMDGQVLRLVPWLAAAIGSAAVAQRLAAMAHRW